MPEVVTLAPLQAPTAPPPAPREQPLLLVPLRQQQLVHQQGVRCSPRPKQRSAYRPAFVCVMILWRRCKGSGLAQASQTSCVSALRARPHQGCAQATSLTVQRWSRP